MDGRVPIGSIDRHRNVRARDRRGVLKRDRIGRRPAGGPGEREDEPLVDRMSPAHVLDHRLDKILGGELLSLLGIDLGRPDDLLRGIPAHGHGLRDQELLVHRVLEQAAHEGVKARSPIPARHDHHQREAALGRDGILSRPDQEVPHLAVALDRQVLRPNIGDIVRGWVLGPHGVGRRVLCPRVPVVEVLWQGIGVVVWVGGLRSGGLFTDPFFRRRFLLPLTAQLAKGNGDGRHRDHDWPEPGGGHRAQPSPARTRCAADSPQGLDCQQRCRCRRKESAAERPEQHAQLGRVRIPFL